MLFAELISSSTFSFMHYRSGSKNEARSVPEGCFKNPSDVLEIIPRGQFAYLRLLAPFYQFSVNAKCEHGHEDSPED